LTATPYELIDKKKRGGHHSGTELDALIASVMDGSMPDYQVAAWLMAVWFAGMNEEETYLLTTRMRDSGVCLDVSSLPGPTADKHSTGGVGDKVSLLLAPLAAEIGLYVPMLSGRGLGHTGGTVDKLSAIPGYRTDLSPQEMLDVVERVGCSITGQTGEIAPADRKLYHLRDVTATVDCVPLIVSSILSKKLAAGPKHLVIDLKCGSGAFMRDLGGARTLARALLETGRRAGRQITALITDMDQPLGVAVGHALEVKESLQGLAGSGPADLRTLTIELVVAMGRLAGRGDEARLRQDCQAALDTGRALERFLAMVRAHGGHLPPDDPSRGLEIAPEADVLVAPAAGWVGSMDAAAVGMAVVDLGGGRLKQDDRLDLSVGLEVLVQVGQEVAAAQPLVRIFGRDPGRVATAKRRLATAVPVSAAPVSSRALILERVV
jgi:pyrimidine-nucleoside phosphorylase